MRQSLLRLAAVLALSLAAFGQKGDDVGTLNRKFLEACFAEKWDEGLGYLAQIDQLNPEDHGTAYNYACVYSRKADVDKAVEWIDKSIQWGWGGGKGSIAVQGSQTPQRIWQSEMLEKDSDLENLRKDPRFAKLIERSKAVQKKAEEYAATPAIFVPEKLKDAAELALLVVLHDTGGNKDATLAAWKPLAEELGYALVAPAAPFALREDLSKGMLWIDDASWFRTPVHTSEYMKAIHASVDALRKTRKLAAGRVFLVGEGEGATLALVTAMQNSGLYKGVAVLDPDMQVATGLVTAKVQTDKANGLRLELRLDPEFWKKRLGGADPKPALDAAKQPVEGWALPGSVLVLGPEAKDAAARQKALADAVRALATAAAATAAPATTPATAPK